MTPIRRAAGALTSPKGEVRNTGRRGEDSNLLLLSFRHIYLRRSASLALQAHSVLVTVAHSLRSLRPHHSPSLHAPYVLLAGCGEGDGGSEEKRAKKRGFLFINEEQIPKKKRLGSGFQRKGVFCCEMPITFRNVTISFPLFLFVTLHLTMR